MYTVLGYSIYLYMASKSHHYVIILGGIWLAPPSFHAVLPCRCTRMLKGTCFTAHACVNTQNFQNAMYATNATTQQPNNLYPSTTQEASFLHVPAKEKVEAMRYDTKM